jgi:hypothetical protein
MGTRANIIIKLKHYDINIFCRSDGYIKNNHNNGLGVDILNAIKDLLSLNKEKIKKETRLNRLHLLNIIIHNDTKETIEYNKEENLNGYYGGVLSIDDSSGNCLGSDFIYNIYEDKIHIEGFDHTTKEGLWSDNLFTGNFYEFKKFIKNYKEYTHDKEVY